MNIINRYREFNFADDTDGSPSNYYRIPGTKYLQLIQPDERFSSVAEIELEGDPQRYIVETGEVLAVPEYLHGKNKLINIKTHAINFDKSQFISAIKSRRVALREIEDIVDIGRYKKKPQKIVIPGAANSSAVDYCIPCHGIKKATIDCRPIIDTDTDYGFIQVIGTNQNDITTYGISGNNGLYAVLGGVTIPPYNSDFDDSRIMIRTPIVANCEEYDTLIVRFFIYPASNTNRPDITVKLYPENFKISSKCDLEMQNTLGGASGTVYAGAMSVQDEESSIEVIARNQSSTDTVTIYVYGVHFGPFDDSVTLTGLASTTIASGVTWHTNAKLNGAECVVLTISSDNDFDVNAQLRAHVV
jgi:hypothetical protein